MTLGNHKDAAKSMQSCLKTVHHVIVLSSEALSPKQMNIVNPWSKYHVLDSSYPSFRTFQLDLSQSMELWMFRPFDFSWLHITKRRRWRFLDVFLRPQSSSRSSFLFAKQILMHKKHDRVPSCEWGETLVKGRRSLSILWQCNEPTQWGSPELCHQISPPASEREQRL